MNKRIKRKVTKRVLNKINDDEQLTKFEKRFFMKYLYPNLKETVSAVIEALKKALPQLIEIATEKVNELSSAMAEAEQANIDEVDSIDKDQKEYVEEKFYKDNKLVKVQKNPNIGIDIGSEGKELTIVNQAYLNKHSKKFQHSFSDVTDERINAGLINAETIDVSYFNFSAPESHNEIQSSVKETKWQKAKGKVKGWFGK